MKLHKLSALLGAAASFLFGTGGEANGGLTPEQAASLEASEKKLIEQEAEVAQLKADAITKDASITSLNAKVTELSAQITTLEGEKKTLTETVSSQKAELDKKPTNQATTVIPGGKEEGQAADQGATTVGSKFRSKQDDESDAYVNALYPNLSKK
jgi:chromosome segregation ATPase